MRPLIRIAFALVFLCLAVLNVFAGGSSLKPVLAIRFEADQFIKLDKMLSAPLDVLAEKPLSSSSKEAAGSGGRICSCQILDLVSSNYDHRHVVLLAEKTYNGNSSDYNIAKARIQKEKKNLKKMFYDKVKLVSETQGTGSCKSLYFKLKTADSQIQLYAIINADIN